MEGVESTSDEEISGQDGRRMELLNYGIRTTVNKCLSAFRYATIKKTFSPIARARPGMLKQIHEQMESQLQKNIMDEISIMFQETNIAPLLNNLEKIIQETSLDPDVKAWRPSGEPSDDILPQLYSTKLKEKAMLEKILKNEEDKNRQLHEALRPRQKRLETARNDVIQQCQYWEEVAAAIPEDFKQRMEKFVKT